MVGRYDVFVLLVRVFRLDVVLGMEWSARLLGLEFFFFRRRVAVLVRVRFVVWGGVSIGLFLCFRLDLRIGGVGGVILLGFRKRFFLGVTFFLLLGVVFGLFK